MDMFDELIKSKGHEYCRALLMSPIGWWRRRSVRRTTSIDAFDAGAVATRAPAYSRARKNEPAPAFAAQQVLIIIEQHFKTTGNVSEAF
jgi:hypothetical protein